MDQTLAAAALPAPVDDATAPRAAARATGRMRALGVLPGPRREPEPAAVVRAVRRLLLMAVAMAAATLAAPALGMQWGVGLSLVCLATAVAIELLPERAFAVVVAAGVAVMLQRSSLRFLGYELLMIGGAYALRRRPLALAALLVMGGIVIPKELFRRFYHQPFLHDWISQFMLTQLVLVCALWWCERRRNAAAEPRDVATWAALFLWPTSALNPLVVRPRELWRARDTSARPVLACAALLVAKAAALLALERAWPGARWTAHTPAQVEAMSPAGLWVVAGGSYLHLALTLSGGVDLVVLVARALGWPLPMPFRWALLAWNPVELWRRWGIYNRRVLLTLVYFPLGGSDRRRLLNVMLTFLASALVLHSGWLGSKYWEVGVGGWRDQMVYFSLQGLAVCACLVWWQWRGKDPAADRDLRWSRGRVAGTIATQAFSAWVHILVLAPHLDWQQRWRVMARCLLPGGSGG